MNVPNLLTCVRIVLAAVFLKFFLTDGGGWKLAALVTFLAASATDYWDGKIARRNGQITPFGQLMDPIADKLLTLSAFGSFAAFGLVPLWTVLVVAARDVLLTAARLFMKSGERQAAHSSGKRKTAFQLFYIVATLGYVAAAESGRWSTDWHGPARAAVFGGMLAVVAITLWSGFEYLSSVRKAPERR